MPLPQVPDEGAFTRRNKQIVNDNFTALTQPDVWVRPQYGNNNSADGTYARPYATAAGLSNILKPGMVVGIEGVLTEDYSQPRVNDVTYLGMGNLPRQATTSTVPNGGGATWLSASGSSTASVFQINGQGCKLQNIFFASGAGVTANPTIKIVNAGDPPASNCGEKAMIVGCFITGTDDGIGAVDLPNNVVVDGCTIFSCSGSGDLGISSATGVGTGTLQGWLIQGCDFLGNAGHITAPFASATIRNNHFSYIYGSTTSTTQVALTGGSNNSIYNNHFDVPYNVNGLTAMFGTIGTNDRWGPNSMGTAVLTPMTGQLWGIPLSGAA